MRPLEPCPNPVDDAAVQHVLGRMSAAEGEAFDRHMLRCERCRSTVRTTRTIVESLRDATGE